jgi:hypothetical protein
MSGATTISISPIQTFTFGAIYPEPSYLNLSKSKGFVRWGHDNAWPRHVESLLASSATHASIVRGSSLFATGEGFMKPVDPLLQGIHDNPNTEAKKGLFGHSMNDFLASWMHDLFLYGSCAIKVRLNKFHTGIAWYDYIDVSSLRYTPDLLGFVHAPDWSVVKGTEELDFYPAFDLNHTGTTQIIHIAADRNVRNPYGTPRYWPARMSIATDASLSAHHLYRLENAFAPSAILSIENYGAMGTEERDALQAGLKKFYQGSSNTSKVMTLDKSIGIEPWNASTTPKDFEHVQRVSTAKILTAHGVVGKGGLFGIQSESGGVEFSTDGLLNEFEVFSKTVIRPAQKLLCDVFDAFARMNGYAGTERFTITPLALFENKAETESEIKEQEAKKPEAEPIDPILDPDNIFQS